MEDKLTELEERIKRLEAIVEMQGSEITALEMNVKGLQSKKGEKRNDYNKKQAL